MTRISSSQNRSRLAAFVPLALLATTLIAGLPNPNPPRIRPTASRIRSLKFLPRESRFVTGSVDGEVLLWPGDSSDPPVALARSTAPVSDLEFSPSANVLAAAFEGVHVELLRLDSNQVALRIDVPAVRVLAFSSDGRALATGTRTGEIAIWDAATGQQITRLEGHRDIVTDIAFAPSSDILATGSQDGRIRLWNWKSRELVRTLVEPHSTILSIALPADSTTLSAVHFDQTVTTWDWESGAKLRQRVGQSHSVGATVSKETGQIAVAGRRGRLAILRDDDRLTTLQYFGQEFRNLAFSHDSRRVIASGAESGIAGWSLDRLRAPVGIGWIPPLYYLCLAAAIVVAVSDWRMAVVHLVLLDGFRDLARKLSADEPRLMTVAILIPWGAVVLSAMLRNRDRVRQLVREHRSILVVGAATVAMLIPAAGHSMLQRPQGASLAALGAVSYLSPFFGIILGYLIAGEDDALHRAARCYAVVCCAFMSGALLEYARADFRGLGGIQFDWIRYFAGSALTLVSGFYRSPTGLGLHAGQATACCLLLAARRPGSRSALWIAATLYCLLCLVLSGRRKMLLLAVCVGALLGIHYFWGLLRKRRRLLAALAVQLVAALAILAIVPSQSLPNQLQYALTTFREGIARVPQIGRDLRTTLAQAGPFGYGLGTVTQGGQFLAPHDLHTWQEDGISRVAAEMGVGGLALLLAGFGIGAWKMMRVWATTPHEYRFAQAVLIGATCGHVASYLESHQAFSGDASASILAACFVGFSLRLSETRQESSSARV
ncbi:MAG: hypothetical protein HY290_25020 [Planctomycetia bacterium]|nr:hypothetical protein [Planctomycetia bacterium]